ncbi:MAG: glycosyltransferase [Thermosynechococcaceae cyanobacterium]
MKIPKYIHQTWKNDKIPYYVYDKKWIQSWKKFHPNWCFKLWTDSDLYSLASICFPEYLHILQKGPGVIRADFGRYLVMYYVGGVYVDLDYECFRDLTPLLKDQELVLTYVDDGHEISNAFLASKPFHPLFKEVLIECSKRFDLHEEVEKRTGPVMFTEVVKTLRLEHHAISSKYLSPISWRKKQSIYLRTLSYQDTFQMKRRYPDAYAVTYWTYNWRKDQVRTKFNLLKPIYTFPNKIIMLELCFSIVSLKRILLLTLEKFFNFLKRS